MYICPSNLTSHSVISENSLLQPMFNPNTTDWKAFVDTNRNVLTVIADTLPIQLELMQTSHVDALVGQLPYGMGYQSAQTIIKVLDDVNKKGVPLEEAAPSDVIFGTHQLEVLRIPLELPPLEFNYNHIGNLATVGYVLCTIVMGASIGFLGWTWYYRKNQVVRASQPMFLIMICVGTLFMGSGIIPLTIDDEKSQRAADIACMCEPWLTNIGFTTTFSALFSKTWRLNKIFLSPNPLRRIKVTEKDVSVFQLRGSICPSNRAFLMRFLVTPTSGHPALRCSPDDKHRYVDLLDCNCPSSVCSNVGRGYRSVEPFNWKLWSVQEHVRSIWRLHSVFDGHCCRQHYRSSGCELPGLSRAERPDRF